MSARLFLLMVFSGLIANLLYFRMARLVAKSGLPTKYFALPGHLIKTLRAYRRMALERGWPVWPLWTFWVTAVVGWGSALILMFGSQLSLKPTSFYLSARLAIWAATWVCISCTALGSLFLYRILSKISDDRQQRFWHRFKQDEYLRSDAYVLLLSFVGVLVSILYLIIKLAV
jgi:hypothetical protein